jgi:hypothetical protein
MGPKVAEPPKETCWYHAISVKQEAGGVKTVVRGRKVLVVEAINGKPMI